MYIDAQWDSRAYHSALPLSALYTMRGKTKSVTREGSGEGSGCDRVTSVRFRVQNGKCQKNTNNESRQQFCQGVPTNGAFRNVKMSTPIVVFVVVVGFSILLIALWGLKSSRKQNQNKSEWLIKDDPHTSEDQHRTANRSYLRPVDETHRRQRVDNTWTSCRWCHSMQLSSRQENSAPRRRPWSNRVLLYRLKSCVLANDDAVWPAHVLFSSSRLVSRFRIPVPLQQHVMVG